MNSFIKRALVVQPGPFSVFFRMGGKVLQEIAPFVVSPGLSVFESINLQSQLYLEAEHPAVVVEAGRDFAPVVV